MSDRTVKVKNQKGVALIIALVILFLLSALAASLIFVTQSEMWSSANYRLLTQSRYAAEAGAQAGVNWFKNSYTAPSSLGSYTITASPVTYSGNPVLLGGGTAANYPDSTVSTAFSTALTNQSVPGVANASYSVTAKLMQMQSGNVQTWQITSVGDITGARGAQTQVVETIQSNMTPIFQDAIFATSNQCGAISFSSGGAFTDAYNSSLGVYGGTNINDTAGSVGTAGNLSMSGGGHIYGNLYTPVSGTGSCSGSGAATNGFTTSGSSTVTGSIVNKAAPNYTIPSPPSGTGTTAQTISGTCPASGMSGCSNSGCTVVTSPGHTKTGVTLSAGNYDNVTSNGGTPICLGAGTYNMNSLNLTGGAPVQLNGTPVVINIAGAGSLSGGQAVNLSGGSIMNSTDVASNLEIVYGGTAGVTLSGGSGSAAVVYAPAAPINFSGGSDWYGAVIGSTITDSGGSAIHYDTALQNSFPMGGSGFSVTGFTWSKN